MNYTHIEKQWTYRGHQCTVTFLAHGHRCGYVLPNSPIFNLVDMDRQDIRFENITPYSYLIAPLQLRFNQLDAHGGITFFDHHGSLPAGRRVGFDCNHYMDEPDIKTLNQYLAAGLLSETHIASQRTGTVGTLDFCITECENLVDQLVAISEEFDYLLTDIPEAFI